MRIEEITRVRKIADDIGAEMHGVLISRVDERLDGIGEAERLCALLCAALVPVAQVLLKPAQSTSVNEAIEWQTKILRAILEAGGKPVTVQ